MRDCITCKHHQPRDIPDHCRPCLDLSEWKSADQPGYLPRWESKEIEVIEIKTPVWFHDSLEEAQYAVGAFVELDPTHDPASGQQIAGGVLKAAQQQAAGLGPKPILPVDSKSRKEMPIATGVLDYFPAAIAYVARISKAGNDKHNPGQPLHHSRGKSNDHRDCIGRHLIECGTFDLEDNLRHSGKLAWRALANLQEELEREEGAPLARGAR